MTGYLGDRRIRRNFKSRQEALTEKASLEIQALQEASGFQHVVTRLSEYQVREAEIAFQRMENQTASLPELLDFALLNYRHPSESQPLDVAVNHYIESKAKEFEQGNLSEPQLKHITWDLGRFQRNLGSLPVGQIRPERVIEFLESRNPSLKTFNNQRGILHTFFKFCYHRNWVIENPIKKVPQHRIRRKRGQAATLSAEQVEELMRFFEDYENGQWVPYFALCLFAGIRPGVPHGEISKLRSDAVCLETGTIHISAAVSKTREPRKVDIEPNLAAWLAAYPLKTHPIILGNFKKRRDRFRKRFDLSHDVMRHTYISMFVAKYRSIGEAAIQAGNSESIVRRHYLDLRSQEEAEAFFSIYPNRRAARP
ncbi:MAG: site-specific integrase [Opitutaceae bacterium]|nr:site-specific integrase [Opitutaceae bacterium]